MKAMKHTILSLVINIENNTIISYDIYDLINKVYSFYRNNTLQIMIFQENNKEYQQEFHPATIVVKDNSKKLKMEISTTTSLPSYSEWKHDFHKIHTSFTCVINVTFHWRFSHFTKQINDCVVTVSAVYGAISYY